MKRFKMVGTTILIVIAELLCYLFQPNMPPTMIDKPPKLITFAPLPVFANELSQSYYNMRNKSKLKDGSVVNAVILGDSISVSQGASDQLKTGWDSDLKRDLNRYYNTNINWINKGLSGKTVDYCLERAKEITADSDLVFICVGRNDRNIYTPEQFNKKYTELINNIKTQAPNADIFCIVEPPMVSPDDSKFVNIRSEILDIADQTNTIPLDVWSTFPSEQDELAKLLMDGLHPNDYGYQVISDYIFGSLSRILSSEKYFTTHIYKYKIMVYNT